MNESHNCFVPSVGNYYCDYFDYKSDAFRAVVVAVVVDDVDCVDDCAVGA